MTGAADILVIGAGIAGASVAHELSGRARVVLLEREDQPGYHSTGRSAALFSECLGPEMMTAMAAASRSFLEHPPDGFAAAPLVAPRGALLIAAPGSESKVALLAADGARRGTEVRLLDPGQAVAMAPVLRQELLALAAFEPGARDIDVDGLLQGYLRGLRGNGGEVVCGADVRAIEHDSAAWHVTTAKGARFSAPLLINAAGAWCDDIAGLAGMGRIGLVAKRRTVLIVAPPPGADVTGWPAVGDIDESFYFKPEAGRLLISPADATPVPPQDAQPEELDIATAVNRIERATTLEIRRIEHKWAGLRTFTADGLPAVGFGGQAEGFFWLAGQGGWGVQTAPAMARLSASLIAGEGIPGDLASLGVSESDLSPRRFRQAS